MMDPSEKGQTVVEALVLSTALMGLVSMLLSCLYIAWFYTCLNFISHEYLVCRSISKAPPCDQSFLKQLRKVSLIGSMTPPRVQQTEKLVALKMSFRWQLLIFKVVDFHYHDQIHLPLAH